ncbi:male sterility protein-domain-containing protein [Mycena galopus ATCC 62051]|nr:male sterility protein-domain-containing protein [Mycena galopus ATCC 62051]
MQTDPSEFFRRQTIFLTGGTGILGGCLLFKLALHVDTHKVYVLVRGSVARARTLLAETMPDQIELMLATGRIQFVVGDVTVQDFGIDSAVLSEMVDNVTVIIHAAANISLKASAKRAVADNCLPTLQLAQLAATFRNLPTFVYISTAYANVFLPDGVVHEKIYDLGDAEVQLSDILARGSTASLPNFPPYTFSKHLTERLLISRNPALPLLIVRPTYIAPAISQPYPYYHRRSSCPLSTYIRAYMTAPDSGVFHVSPQHTSGSNILDEIPVDLVANLILLHIMRRTTGVVHACSQSYVPRSLAQLHDSIRPHLPPDMARNAFQYISDPHIPEGDYARFWHVLGRDWHFSNLASQALSEVKGPLAMVIDDHDAHEFMMRRAKLIAKEVSAHSKSKL